MIYDLLVILPLSSDMWFEFSYDFGKGATIVRIVPQGNFRVIASTAKIIRIDYVFTIINFV